MASCKRRTKSKALGDSAANVESAKQNGKITEFTLEVLKLLYKISIIYMFVTLLSREVHQILRMMALFMIKY